MSCRDLRPWIMFSILSMGIEFPLLTDANGCYIVTPGQGQNTALFSSTSLALTGNLTVGTATAGTNAFVVVGNTALTGNTALMGNVGIGKTNPVFPLDICGAIQSSNPSTATFNNFYGKVPPTNTYLSSFSPNSANATSATWINNGVAWTASSSNTQTSNSAYKSFDLIYSNSAASISAYNTTSGAYAPTTNSQITNIVGQTSQLGEWIQIQSNVPLTMSSYQFGSGGTNLQLPKTFWIVGSNDNATWYPIQNCSFSTNPTSTNYVLITGAVTVNAISNSSTVGSATLTTTPYGTATNGYTYFRLIATSIFTNNTYGNFEIGEWLINFSPATLPGPSKTLLYMDASNINQLDVSGSLAVVNSNPSTMFVSPNTTAAVSYTWQNNNVIWTASESNPQSGNLPYKAFNLTYSDSAAVTWSYSSGAYVGNAGNSAVTTQTTNISSPGPGNVNGDWFQIQSSIPLVMKNYQFATGGLANQMPKTFWIVGSNDGSTWYPIQYCSFSVQPSSTNNALISGVVTVGAASSTVGSATLTTSTPSTMANAYTYFRLIALTVCATSGANNLEIGEWLINFSPASSAVSLALDIATPNQLNVGGSLFVTGPTKLGSTGISFSTFQFGSYGGTSASSTINFPTPFATVPVVIITGVISNATYFFNYQVSGVSTTSFTYRQVAVSITSNPNVNIFGANDSHTLNWMAFAF